MGAFHFKPRSLSEKVPCRGGLYPPSFRRSPWNGRMQCAPTVGNGLFRQAPGLPIMLGAVLASIAWLVCLSPASFCPPAPAQNSPADNSRSSNVMPQESGRTITYSEERPANFVFLLDVSGSMLFAREQVKSADGSLVTLFEALRQALKQIVQDERLVTPQSKISFITFGTQISEKNEWPTALPTAKERSELLARISSNDELQADKHGDTYMAGGLAAAYARAEQFASQSQPCTATFIVMLTDGWDEPPAGAKNTVAGEADKFQNKAKELKQKLGVNTWQVRVVGLQQLPDKKAGTTTAVEVARLLGGEFIDVSKTGRKTVAGRIYQAMKQTIADLRGQVDVQPADCAYGIIDFGRITDRPYAGGSCKVWNRSCYVEKLTAVVEAGQKVKAAEAARWQKKIASLAAQGSFRELPEQGKNLVLTARLPAGAIKLKLDLPEYLLSPLEKGGDASSEPSGNIAVTVGVGSSCPPGAYLGFMGFDSTAKVPALLPYLLTVPSRLTVDCESVKVQVRKPGFIFDSDTSCDLLFQVGARVNSSYASDFDVLVQSGPAVAVGLPPAGNKSAAGLPGGASKSAAGLPVELPVELINNGQPLSIKVNSGAEGGCPVRLSVKIPADTQPGKYEGRIQVKLREHNDLVSDTSVPFMLEVLPSPWDEMSPVAVPVLLVLVLVSVVGVFMAVVGSRERV
jgi:Mg-chelatase subunit ChlD